MRLQGLYWIISPYSVLTCSEFRATMLLLVTIALASKSCYAAADLSTAHPCELVTETLQFLAAATT